jgi:hypothetical protein
MGEFLTQLTLMLRARFKSRVCLEAENVVLRQQRSVLNRRSPDTAPTAQHRSADLGVAMSPVSVAARRDHYRQARDCASLASTRGSRLRALEVMAAWGKTQDQKKLDNHRFATALHFVHSNFARSCQTVSPAVDRAAVERPSATEQFMLKRCSKYSPMS